LDCSQTLENFWEGWGGCGKQSLDRHPFRRPEIKDMYDIETEIYKHTEVQNNNLYLCIFINNKCAKMKKKNLKSQQA